MSGYWILSLALGVAAYEFRKRGKRTNAAVCVFGAIVFMVLDLM